MYNFDLKDEQISHLRRISQRKILRYLQGSSQKETRVCGHQTNGQGSQGKDNQLGKDTRRPTSFEYHQVLRIHGNKEPHVGSH